MTHFTKNGVPMSAPMGVILDHVQSNGFELKPLAYGVRIMGTDVVASDHWRGLYLCKSGGRGLERTEHEGAVLRPADKSQWCVSVGKLATDPEEAAAQATAMLHLVSKAGYFLPPLGEAEVSSAAEDEAPVEPEPVSPEPVEAAEDEVPKRSKRRKKGKGKKEAKSEPATALDDALNAID